MGWGTWLHLSCESLCPTLSSLTIFHYLDSKDEQVHLLEDLLLCLCEEDQEEKETDAEQATSVSWFSYITPTSRPLKSLLNIPKILKYPPSHTHTSHKVHSLHLMLLIILLRMSMRHPSSLNRNRSMRRTQRPSQRFPPHHLQHAKVDGQQADGADGGEQGDGRQQQGDGQHLLLGR